MKLLTYLKLFRCLTFLGPYLVERYSERKRV